MRVDEMMKHAQVASPCSANWDEMTGDEKMRLCAQCNLHVLDATAMTDVEVLRALQLTMQGGEVCMRFYRRADGRFLTKDCPIGWALVSKRARQAAKHAAAWLSGALTVVLSCAAGAASNSGSNGSATAGTSGNGSASRNGSPSRDTKSGASANGSARAKANGSARANANTSASANAGADGKQKWYCKITGAGSAEPGTTATNTGIAADVDDGPHFTDYTQGRMKIWTKAELAVEERSIEALKSQGLNVKAADAILNLIPKGFYTRTISKNLAMYRDAMQIYESSNEWRKAAEVSSRLATLFDGSELHNDALATKYRRLADEFFLRGASTTAQETQSASKLVDYEKSGSWAAAEALCIKLCAESLKGHNEGSAMYWDKRGRHYTARKNRTNRTLPVSPTDCDRFGEGWEKAVQLAKQK